MRFGVPRSPSPPPVAVRQKSRRRSTLGVPSDSDDSSECSSDEEALGSLSEVSSSSDSFFYESESEVHPLRQLNYDKGRLRTPAEQRRVEATIASIRLLTRHHYPYEEWEKQARKDAFRTARKTQRTIQARIHDERDKAHIRDSERRAALHAHQVAEVQARLSALELQYKTEETKLKEAWRERDRKLWERIDAVIMLEEEKTRKRLEAERMAKEEEERKRLEEEMIKRLEEEMRQQEEENRRKAEEEERRRKQLEEEEAKRRREEEERMKNERLRAEEEGRKALGVTTAEDDWVGARVTLKKLKQDPMNSVKSQKDRKAAWSALRRQITPKIGQLTNDPQAIARISRQLHDIIVPSPPHPPDIYQALLSSLSKAILLQAETEVTAEKRSAGPLAQVTANLLGILNEFPEVFFAKLVQRAGGWPVPMGVPLTDVDGQPWKGDEERAKVHGWRKGNGGGEGELENSGEYISRMTGMMRVYFGILKVPVEQPLHKMFQLPRYWTWFARMLDQRKLLELPVAPQIIYAALDVFGLEAKSVWGQQWVKMLELLYEGVTVGMEGGALIGGQSAEGIASRARVQLEVERIMNSP